MFFTVPFFGVCDTHTHMYVHEYVHIYIYTQMYSYARIDLTGTIDKRGLGAIIPKCPNQTDLRHIIIFPYIYICFGEMLYTYIYIG